MADIDFDELDQAVNRLMNQRNSKTQEPRSASPVPSTTDSARSDLATQSTAAESAVPSAPKPVTPAPQQRTAASPAIKRRSGRVMDIVHPSQSAAGRARAAAPKRPVSRSGATLTPSSATITSEGETVSAALDTPASTEASIPPTTTSSIADRIAATLAGHDDQPAENPQVAQPVEIPTPASAPQDTPLLQSPFLANTEVTKRPLGGAPKEDVLQSEGQVDDITAKESLDEVITPEMDEAILAVEAREVSEHADVSLPDEPKAEEAKPVEAAPPKEEPAQKPAEADHEELLLPAHASPDAPTPTEPAQKPTAQPRVPGDIPKQYNVTPSDEDEPSSIYDPAHYHETLDHPVRKKSGWWIVLWISLLLILGAGAGAAVYIYLLS